MPEILQNEQVQALLLALLGAEGLIVALNDQLAAFVRRVPVIGGLLARLVRRASLGFWDWLENRVQDAADQSVKEAVADSDTLKAQGQNAKLRASSSPAATKARARENLDRRKPGMSTRELDDQINRAMKRLRADQERAESAESGAAS